MVLGASNTPLYEIILSVGIESAQSNQVVHGTTWAFFDHRPVGLNSCVIVRDVLLGVLNRGLKALNVQVANAE